MLKLENYLTLDQDAVKAANLCDRFDKGDLDAIGRWVFDGYTADKQSRAKWEKRMENALDLAMQLQKEKTFPWSGASNVAFPLVTIGAMQFHARAYPTIIQGTDVAKMRVIGSDPDNIERERADRVGRHMSYQVLEEDTAWEEQHDRLLLILGIVGCCFVKTRHDPDVRHNVSELVMARDLIVNYWAKSIDEASRKTHRYPISRNDIRDGVLSGIFEDVLEEGWYVSPKPPAQTMEEQRSNTRVGMTPTYQPDEVSPFYALEMHCLLDLDGDGYAEPYIVTIEETSRAVLRIVSRIGRYEDIDFVEKGKYKGQIRSIRREEYFTKYSFIPSPDGGIYDIGFGMLLGPINESVNSIINQLVDCGTINNTAGGFLGRGAKIRGGVYQFKPFEWNRVDSTGDDLRKSIFPLPVRDPSSVLFQLLGLLVNYANRISGSTDTMVGENPGQNTPAQTTQTMVEMGMKIYNSIFKRVWRSMKDEFKKLYILNAVYMPDMQKFGSDGSAIGRDDYLGDPDKIVPYADPNITSEAQGQQQALMLKQFAQSTPGYNWEEVERRVLRSMRVDGIDAVYPGLQSDKATHMPDPKGEAMQGKLALDQARLEFDKAKFAQELMEEMKVNRATIIELEARASKELAEGEGVAAGHQLAALDAAIGAAKQRNEHIYKQLELVLGMQDNERQRQHEQEIERQRGAVEDVATGPSDAGAA